MPRYAAEALVKALEAQMDVLLAGAVVLTVLQFSPPGGLNSHAPFHDTSIKTGVAVNNTALLAVHGLLVIAALWRALNEATTAVWLWAGVAERMQHRAAMAQARRLETWPGCLLVAGGRLFALLVDIGLGLSLILAVGVLVPEAGGAVLTLLLVLCLRAHCALFAPWPSFDTQGEPPRCSSYGPQPAGVPTKPDANCDAEKWEIGAGGHGTQARPASRWLLVFLLICLVTIALVVFSAYVGDGPVDRTVRERNRASRKDVDESPELLAEIAVDESIKLWNEIWDGYFDTLEANKTDVLKRAADGQKYIDYSADKIAKLKKLIKRGFTDGGFTDAQRAKFNKAVNDTTPMVFKRASEIGKADAALFPGDTDRDKIREFVRAMQQQIDSLSNQILK